MNPLYIGALARTLIAILAGRGVTLAEDTAMQIVYGVVALVTLLWSLRQKKQTIDEKASRW